MAYSFPKGIPTDVWIDPTITRPVRPDPWTSEVPGYYYIDYTNGTNTGRTYGTPSAPRQTIPSPVPAGSYIEITGTYSQVTGGSTIIKVAGDTNEWVANTSGPVWIVGLDANNRASFTWPVIFDGSGLCVEYCDNLAGFKSWQLNSTTASAGRTATNMLIRNCELDGDNTTDSAALSIVGSISATSTDIIIYNNVVHGFGPLVPDTDRDNVGIFAHNYNERVWIIDNVVYEMSGSGISCATNTSSPSTTNNIFIGRNHVYEVWASGISFKTTNNVIISENHIHNIVYTDWSQAKGIGGQYAALNTWILYNVIHHCDYGIRLGSTNEDDEFIYIIGNIVYEVYPVEGATYGSGAFAPSAIALWGADHRFVVNNTVYNASIGIGVTNGGSPPDGLIIENNIISEITDIHVIVENSVTGVEVNNNIFYQTGGGASITYGGTTRTIAEFELAGLGTNNLTDDPDFYNASSYNFNIGSASPARSNGLTPDSLAQNIYSDFNTSFNVSIYPPYFEESDWAIGALQYVKLRFNLLLNPV